MPTRKRRQSPKPDPFQDMSFLPEEVPAVSRKKKAKKSNTLSYIVCALVVLMLTGGAYIYFNVVRPMTATIDPGASFNEDGVMILDDDLVVTEDELIYVDPNDLSPNMGLGEETINILLLGVDARTAGKFDGLSDTMIILSLNPASKDVKLTSIMRDTLVTIPGRTKQQKINAANAFGGPNLAIKTVNEVFGMNINDYVIVNFQSVMRIVDAIGGIEMDITDDEMKQINENLNGYRGDLIELGVSYDEKNFEYLKKSGNNISLNGHQALAYARIRKIDSDYVRAERQRNVITAVAQKVRNSNILTISSLAAQLFPYVSTSLGVQDIISLATVALGTDFDTVEEMQLPVNGTFQSGRYNGMWCIKPNLEKNRKLLHDFIYGTEEEET